MGFSTYPSLLGSGSAPYSYYATWNLFDKAANISLHNGRLRCVNTGGYDLVRATIGVSAASANTQVYWEVKVNSFSFFANLGISNAAEVAGNANGVTANGWGYKTGGGFCSVYNNNHETTGYGVQYFAGNIVSFLLDMGAGTLDTWMNGTANTGHMVTGLTGTIYPTASTYGGNAFDYTAFFDPSTFTYTPPAGFAGLHH